LGRYNDAIYSVDSLQAGLALLSHAAGELGFEGVGGVLWPAASAAATEDARTVRVIKLMVTLRLSLTLSGA
jgi:hypothetical protein